MKITKGENRAVRACAHMIFTAILLGILAGSPGLFDVIVAIAVAALITEHAFNKTESSWQEVTNISQTKTDRTEGPIS